MLENIIQNIIKINSDFASLQILYISFCLLVGIAFGLFGKYLLYVFLAVVGFCIGYVLASLGDADLAIRLIAGLVLAAVNVMLYIVGILIIGAIIGLIVCLILVPETDPIIYVVFALIGAIISFFVVTLISIVTTSFIGATLITSATFTIFSMMNWKTFSGGLSNDFISYLISVTIDLDDPSSLISLRLFYVYEITILTIAFCIFQLFGWSRNHDLTDMSHSEIEP